MLYPIVYIIQMDWENDNVQKPPDLIKVGYTSLDPEKRRSTLNTGNPYKLKYVKKWMVNDGINGEKAAHDSLAGLEARPDYGGGSEWFKLPDGGLLKAQKLIEAALLKGGYIAIVG